MEKRFDEILGNVLTDMIEKDDNMCCSIYWDDMCKDNAIVTFMEYGGYVTMHAVMKDLHDRLSTRMGYPVSVCHNDPTDESVLILGSKMDSSVYEVNKCCKHSVLTSYYNWNESGRGDSYRPEVRSLFFAAECLAENLNKTPEYVLRSLNWDQDPQAQMIRLLLDYHC